MKPAEEAEDAEERIQLALETGAKELDLSAAELTTLPKSLGQLTNLQILDLSENQLKSFPKVLGQLTNLQELFLTDNELTSLPKWLGKLSKLEWLNLDYNQLTSLPDSLDQLTNLKFLDLAHSQLTSLPETLGQLTDLLRLDLGGNNLTSLPDSLRKLTSLEELYLHRNDVLGLPAEVLGPTYAESKIRDNPPANPAVILDYYFRIRGEARPLNEAKLILVGRGGVGKTSLVNRLVHDSFDAAEKKTPGIKITEWPVALGDDENVRLNIWDFGGQEIMHATHQFFLTQRSLYLLVLNGREGGEDADADYWLRLIESFAEDSPVIVVLNKVKEHPFDLDRTGLKQKFPAIADFVPTDCSDPTEEDDRGPIGIDDLRRVIARETDRLEHLRDAFPASWFDIKDRLADMGKRKENYVTFEDFRRICADHGEADPGAQELLAGYLHSLGIALNYRDDSRLRDMHVLNPHWVTNGIYGLLNAEDVTEQRGELGIADLPGILDSAAYPPERHRFLIDLMRKFELCFSFPDNDDHFLIPELLAKEQPPEVKQFDLTGCLNFQYHYPVLPEGLLSRFIVRTHGLSTAQPRWRTGVMLHFGGNRALVRADVQDKKVFVSVSGPPTSRRELLAVIRSDFAHIHASFTFDPTEMVPLPDHPEHAVPYQDLIVMQRAGEKTITQVIGDEVMKHDVQSLLNGVDLEGARRARKPDDMARGAKRLFYSYSHKDESWRNELETHLKILQHRGLIDTWHDRNIEAGDDWKTEIDHNLERADIILLLISADFIASKYCWELEMKRALDRDKAGKATVVPIIIRDVNWNKSPFARLQALPTDGKAVSTWENRDTAWRNVSDGIEKLVAPPP